MSEYIVTDTELTGIANAIRTKGGTSAPLEFPDDFVDAIDDISTGTDTSDATATAGDILSGKTAYIATGKATGTIPSKSSSDLTASGDTVSVPAGYYASAASKAVAAGTEGTPTNVVSPVNNHSVIVSPRVTNTEGYIPGTQKVGSNTTIYASDLVSGTKTITGSGTTDVTNYAEASVAAGSAVASATKGTVSNHSVAVTPSVTKTAGYIAAGTTSGTPVVVTADELISFSTIYTGRSAPASSLGVDGDIYLQT